MAIVQVENFSFAYPGEGRGARSGKGAAADVERAFACDAKPAGGWALRNVSFSVEEGAFCVLVGPTGCGKTTLLRALKPELAPAGEKRGCMRVLGRTVLEDGVAVAGLTARESAEQIGFVLQDPAAQIVCDTVWHELAFGLENLGMGQDEMRRRIAEVAHFFGIEPVMRAATETLSGGQKQLVNLAAVLALRPRLLLLDEPTAQLDPNAQRQFVFMLARVNRELGTTVVMATHAPEDAEPYVTQRVELGYVPPLGERAAVRVPLAVGQEPTPSTPSTPALLVKDAFFRYGRRDPWVLRGLSVRVSPGTVYAFVGGNGCGKTTLLHLMAGVLKPQRGRVLSPHADRQVLMPQDPKALLVCDTVAEELAEWRARCGYTAEDERRVCARFDLDGLENRHPYDLSGGQQQKLALAKLLLADPQLLFLDEPTKGLDASACADAAHMVRALAAEGRTVVLVTHDLDFAYAVADEVSMLFDGELACTEPAATFVARNLVYRPHDRSRFFGALAACEGRQP